MRGAGKGALGFGKAAIWYNAFMPKKEVKDTLDRVLSWPEEDQDKVMRFVEQLEEWRSADEVTGDEVSAVEAGAGN